MLKVTNLQFPFDHSTQGGFTLSKQAELAAATTQSPNRRKRPVTAGRSIRMREGAEIFINATIAANSARKQQRRPQSGVARRSNRLRQSDDLNPNFFSSDGLLQTTKI
jgi:hypothetical protein